MKLFEFQENAFNQLKDFIFSDDKKDVIFKSPTGSGKTIILSNLINYFFSNFTEFAFIWLTPGQGDLEEQSNASFARNFPHIVTKNVEELIVSGLNLNEIAFINWEKLNKKGNNALKPAERLNFQDQLEITRNNGIKIIVIIDESHKNYTEKSSNILNMIKPFKLIRASATPKNKKDNNSIIVKDEDVIEEGLIKKFISINENIKNELVFNNETTFLISKAFDKRLEIKNHFLNNNIFINPLVIIQLPNAMKGDLVMNEAITFLTNNKITLDNRKLAIWLNNKKVNLDNIQDFNSSVDFIIIKQAIATGRDCPRAYILVKLRDGQDEDFEIQTIGRIRRMPELKHYDDDVLDKCYLYTFDQKYTSGVKESIEGSGVQKNVHLKEKYLNVIPPLIKEDKDVLNTDPDETKIFNIIKNYFIYEYKLANDKKTNFRILQNNSFRIGDKVVRNISTGDIKSLSKEDIKNLGKITVNNVLSKNSLISLRNLYLETISKFTSLSNKVIKKIIHRLFGTDGIFINLTEKEELYFTINNYYALSSSFRNAIYYSLGKGLPLEINKKTTYYAPNSDFVRYKNRPKEGQYIENNAYAEYPVNPFRDSHGEKAFEKFLEDNSNVERYYKNGDKGPQYFSIIYANNLGVEKRFFPDFIFKCKNDIRIVEIKGNLKDKDGNTKDIDKASYLKFDALKEYGEKYKIHTGFVRFCPIEDDLMISLEKYSEDGQDGNRKNLRRFFRTNYSN